MSEIGYTYGLYNSRHGDLARPPRPPLRFPRISLAEREERRQRYVAAFKALGVTHKQIASKLGKSVVNSYSYAYGNTIVRDDVLSFIEALTADDFPKGRIDLRHARDKIKEADCIARLLAGETLRSISESYGITKQRVQKITARAGIINPHHALAAQRKERRAALALEKQAINAAKIADRNTRLAAARELVVGGMSIRKAMAAHGFTRGIDRLAKGWPTRYGRWRNK